MDDPAVLVVDDEPAHLRALSRALGSLAEVRVADGGAAALPQLDDGRVALVISDQRMGGMSGVELLERVRARRPDAVLILLTAYADLAALRDAINRIGIYHYVEKPWNLSQLRQVVARGLERFQLERQRCRLLGELRREAEYKTRLLALLAHELGTPVHIAVNAIGLLSEIPADPRAVRWIEALQRAGDWLARGVGQMQRASCVASSAMRLRAEALDLSQVVAGALDAIRLAASSRRIEFAYCATAGGVWVCADRSWLHEVVWNLLTNAVRFTPDGGRVCVSTARRPGRGVLVVADSGIGFRPAALEDLFVPFSSASGDPALHGSGWLGFGARGLGLGLSLCKRITDAHGGTIAVDATSPAGTRMRVEIPAFPPWPRAATNPCRQSLPPDPLIP